MGSSSRPDYATQHLAATVATPGLHRAAPAPEEAAIKE